MLADRFVPLQKYSDEPVGCYAAPVTRLCDPQILPDYFVHYHERQRRKGLERKVSRHGIVEEREPARSQFVLLSHKLRRLFRGSLHRRLVVANLARSSYFCVLGTGLEQRKRRPCDALEQGTMRLRTCEYADAEQHAEQQPREI